MLMQVRSDVEQGSALGKIILQISKIISTASIAIWSAQASPAAYWKAYWTNWLSIKKKPKPLRKSPNRTDLSDCHYRGGDCAYLHHDDVCATCL